MPRCLFLYPNNAFFWSRGKWKRVIQIWDCSCRTRSPLLFLLSALKPKADHVLLCFHLRDTEDLMPSTKYLCKNGFIISVCKRWITVFYIFSFCWRSFWSFDFNLSGKRTTSSSYNTAFPSYLKHHFSEGSTFEGGDTGALAGGLESLQKNCKSPKTGI